MNRTHHPHFPSPSPPLYLPPPPEGLNGFTLNRRKNRLSP
jgi:hypothetical protein